MTVSELRERHFELFGTWPRSFHRQHLERELAWHIQAKEYGGLPEDVRKYALAIAADLADPHSYQGELGPAGSR